MNRSRAALIGMLALAPTLASCGPGDGPVLYPVNGKVIYKGQPAAGATVIFRREDAPPPVPNAPPLIPVAQAGEDGTFSLAIEDVGRGAPAGKYTVLVEWRTKAEGTSEPQATPKKKSRQKIVPDKPDGTPDRLGGRYMKAESPRFRAEVKPETNNLEPFDVSS